MKWMSSSDWSTHLSSSNRSNQRSWFRPRGIQIHRYVDSALCDVVWTDDSNYKTKIMNGDSIPNVYYACDVCRVLLCKICFDMCMPIHHCNCVKPCDLIVSMWMYWYDCVHNLCCIFIVLRFCNIISFKNLSKCIFNHDLTADIHTVISYNAGTMYPYTCYSLSDIYTVWIYSSTL